jgi:hypothetical protein
MSKDKEILPGIPGKRWQVLEDGRGQLLEDGKVLSEFDVLLGRSGFSRGQCPDVEKFARDLSARILEKAREKVGFEKPGEKNFFVLTVNDIEVIIKELTE